MDSSSPYSRLFTINEANALLPIVRPTIERILEIIRRLRAKSEIVIRAEQIDPETPHLMRRLQQNDEIAALIKQINDAVNEIQQTWLRVQRRGTRIARFSLFIGRRDCLSLLAIWRT